MPFTELYLIRHGLPEYEFDSQGRKMMYGPSVSLSEEEKVKPKL